MNRDFSELRSVLEAWFKPVELRDLQINEATGGLSGAHLWRITQGNDSFCLRRWPMVHPSATELTAIHGFMTHLEKAGFQIVPLPQRTLTQQTFLNVAGNLWELANWLPGEALEKPSAEQITAAMEALARLHLAAASYGMPPDAPAPGLQKRRAILQNLRDGWLAQLDQAVRGATPSALREPQAALRETALAMLADIRQVLPSTLSVVEKTVSVALPLQWCLRDIHIGNLLFTDNRVTGIVDFGAAGIDSVAGDIARLVGSLAGDDANLWRECLRTYQILRPLSAEELHAVALFDGGGLIAAATNWLRWLFVERRQFADAATTQTRLTELARRLKSYNERRKMPSLGHTGPEM